mgnify:CR=1 FL=1
MKLREYQTKAIDLLRQSLGSGNRRVVMQLPTGAGKTVIAAAIINMARKRDKRVIFAVPSLTLIDQTVQRFRQNGITEIGVMQSQHEMTDPRQPVQICSIQTLMRRELPDAHLVIIDECHQMFEFVADWVNYQKWEKVPFVGLTATPWARGMGKIWNDLIIGTTMQDLIDLGHLSKFRVFAPAHPDLKGVKTTAGDYNLKDLGEAMDNGALVADIVTTWLEKGQNRQTVCFAVNRTHAKHIQKQFEDAGVFSEYMDAFTPMDERAEIIKRFQNRDTQILCNVGVLTTGFDADVRCIILARPTKSEMLYVQMIGRGLRPAIGKDHCLILDHSDTTIRLGFVTDIHHDRLHSGKKDHKTRDKTPPLPKECPKCTFLKPPKTAQCPACGFKAEAIDRTEVVDGELHELTGKGKNKRLNAKEWHPNRKQTFWEELLLHCHLRGYKQGWAAHAYKTRLGVWPRNLIDRKAPGITMETESWIRSYNIRKAKAREKENAAASTNTGTGTGTLGGDPSGSGVAA